MLNKFSNQKHKRKTLILFILFIAFVGFLFYIKKINKPDEIQFKCPDCNVVLISIDPLRVSNIGVYGYEKDTTPTIDKLSENSFVFTNAVSVSSWTLPSAMSLLTGVYPSRHKVLNKFTLREGQEEEISNLNDSSPDLKTIAQVFKEAGYKTGGFTGGAAVDSQFGFDQGFDIYTSEEDFGGLRETVPKALDWLTENKDEKLFVFLHGYSTHGQYIPEEGYDYRFVDFDYKGKLTGSKEEQKELREEGLSRGQIFLTEDDVRFLTALYNEKVQRADNLFAQFIQNYQKLGLFPL